MSTATILGLPALVLLVGAANDSSQRSIKSSAEILGDASAFRSHSAKGSRDYSKGRQKRTDQKGENDATGFQRNSKTNLNNGIWTRNHCKMTQEFLYTVLSELNVRCINKIKKSNLNNFIDFRLRKFKTFKTILKQQFVPQANCS